MQPSRRSTALAALALVAAAANGAGVAAVAVPRSTRLSPDLALIANASDLTGMPVQTQILAHLHGAERQPVPGWTSTEPDSVDYNEETNIRGYPYSVEQCFAAFFCLMLASAPFILASLAEKQLTRAHMVESVALISWLFGVLFLFTSVLKFQSAHFDGYRCLTLTESVYLLSQVLTTVGYGDITPAFPRGQVWVGFNVIIALCLYGSAICEVTEIVQLRIAKALQRGDGRRAPGSPLKDWIFELKSDQSELVKSACWFVALASVGVLFWHYYPGEGKTWLQAVYMSVITLSTVGFGAFTAVTEGGKVFGAFWMLFGVASLGALITNFIDTMHREKQVEARRCADVHGEFTECIKAASEGRKKMTKEQFLIFGLMLTKKTSPKELHVIQKRFEALLKEGGKDGHVRRTTLVDLEGPPLG